MIDAGIDVEICEGEQVQLNALGNATQFAWIPILHLIILTLVIQLQIL